MRRAAAPAVLCSLLLQATWPTAAQPPGSLSRRHGQKSSGAIRRDAGGPSTTPAAADVFDRLLVLLQTIPRRWESLPPPLVPLSGRSVEEVLRPATDVQQHNALQDILRLLSVPAAGRPAVIQEELRRPLTEVDVWEPLLLIDDEKPRSFRGAAATVEAWLQRSAALGRKDALKIAASTAIDILQVRLAASTLLPVAETWAALPSLSDTDRGQAMLQLDLAKLLLNLGEPQRALAVYRSARTAIVALGVRSLESSSWSGEAEVLVRLGKHWEALDAYRKARQISAALEDQAAVGMAWEGEAEVMFRLGNNQQALEAYGKARQLFDALGDQLEQANVAEGEADVLHRRGEDQKALDAYRTARRLYIAVGNRLGQGNSWKGEGDELALLGEPEKALDAYRTARQSYLAIGDRSGQGATWRSEALVLAHLGHVHEALAAHRTARPLLLAAGDRSGQAANWRDEADALFLLGQAQRALDAFRTARQLFLAERDQAGQGSTWKGEAEALLRLGQNQQALAAYGRARQLYAAVDDRHGQGNTWDGEATVLLHLGDMRQALDDYRIARRLFIAAGDVSGQGYTWEGEANVLSHIGKSYEALRAYQTARQLLTTADNKSGQAYTWQGEAELLSYLGEDSRALAACGKARQLFADAGDPVGEGNTWNDEAAAWDQLGERRKAIDAYQKARQLFVALGDTLGQGNTWQGEAAVHAQLGERAMALDAFRRARQLFSAVGNRSGEGNAWEGEAMTLLTSHAWPDSAVAARAAVASARSTGTIGNQVSALLLQTLAEAALGNLQAAARSATEAIELHGRWRTTFITDRLRTNDEETIAVAYDLLVPLRARQPGQAAEALRLAEEARARVLLDLLATAPTRRGRVSAVDLLAERQRLEAEAWKLEAALRAAPAPLHGQNLRQRRRELDRQLAWNDFRRIGSQGEGLAASPPLATPAIQHLAHDSGPMLLYYASLLEVWGFLILPTSSEIIVHSIALPRDELGREVSALSRDLANPLYEARATARAHKLWNLLIAPFSDRLPTRGPLVLVPHGPLHELPFEALLDPSGRPLFQRWATSVTPSASALALASRRHAAPSPRDSFVAFSSGEGLHPPAAEVDEISGLFNAGQPAFHPTEALYSNYEKLASRARHLFIATRGVHTEDSRSGTYLEIEPTPAVHDSRLSAAEIATIPLQAELVTLAACDTSHGHALWSDERLDLARSFLIARAAAVLASRWKVPEGPATSRFLIDFYRAYRRGGAHGRGLRKDEALNEARRLSRERGDPAQVWAAWVLVGDAR